MSPRAAPPKRRRRKFGTTWWGSAWVETLEERARLDRNRLARGRTYLNDGRVGQLAVEPGEVRAGVRGSRGSRYLVRVALRRLSDREWDRVLDAFAAQAAHAAALLDGELPPEVIGSAADAGVDLLPGPGDVRLRCTCPDWAEPCKHAAAVSYLVADVLDADPFALLLLRGRTRQEVLDGLRRRRSAPDDRGQASSATPLAPATDAGVEAREAFSRWIQEGRVSLPPIPLPPRRPGPPAPLPGDPPAAARIRRNELAELASGAARGAWALLTGEDAVAETEGLVERHTPWWHRPLRADERAAAAVASAWFHELRTMPLPKSFPMVAIQALYEGEALFSEMRLDDVARRCYDIMRRSPNLAADLDGVRLLNPDNPDTRGRREWWRRRGLAAWVEPASLKGRFFRIEGDALVAQLPVAPGTEDTVCDMTLDLVLDRLARYQPRG